MVTSLYIELIVNDFCGCKIFLEMRWHLGLWHPSGIPLPIPVSMSESYAGFW